MMFNHHNHDQCIHDALKKAEAICAERGSRLTDQRKHVLSLIWESHRPVKAYDLLEKLAKTKGKIQPPTVYRALDFLLEHGLIHRIDSLNAYTGCIHPETEHDGMFLICNTCGNADENISPSLKNAIHKTLNDCQFQQENITIEISGICQTCSQ